MISLLTVYLSCKDVLCIVTSLVLVNQVFVTYYNSPKMSVLENKCIKDQGHLHKTSLEAVRQYAVTFQQRSWDSWHPHIENLSFSSESMLR